MHARSLGASLARAGASVSLQPKWGVMVAVAGFVAVVIGVFGAVFGWQLSLSPGGRAERQLDLELRHGRGCLLSQDWAHVDPETGLVVAKLATVISCGAGDRAVEPSPDSFNRPEEFVAGWNDELKRRLAAGETCGPRFLDRVTTLDAVRERFRRDAASAVALPRYDIVPIGGREVRWWGSLVLVRELGSQGFEGWKQPVGGAPMESLDQGGDVDVDVRMLLADQGHSLWVRVASLAGDDLWFLVVDLATGTHLYVFPVSPR